ncbi:MAG: surface lipoprotein assembly modifier [Desulfobacula sp.]|jgi:tetratricopeptide (TPR) repeat protein
MKKIILFLMFIFIPTCSFGTDSLSNSDENHISIATKLFDSGEFLESYNFLLKAFENNPENLDLNFYLGRAAFEIGNYEMAIMAFERILIVSPHENRVKLEIARAFQKLGANNTAIQYCQEVLATNPPESVRKNINAFLTLIKKSEQTHFFNGQVATGIDWNNNIWASPSINTVNTIIGDVNLTGASSQKTQDWIYNTTIGLQHAYRMPFSDSFWKTDVTFYDAIYDKTSALDIKYFGGNTGPEFISGGDRWGLRLLFNHIDLGNMEYQNGLGLKILLDHNFNPYCLNRTVIKFEEKDFPDNPGRDANNISLTSDINYLFNQNWIGIGIKAENENADDDENTYKRWGSNISISRELPFDTTATATYAYQFSTYEKPGSLFTKSREDHQHSVGFGLKKKLWQAQDSQDQTVSLNLNYQHVWAFSNIELYEYEQDLFQMVLQYAF